MAGSGLCSPYTDTHNISSRKISCLLGCKFRQSVRTCRDEIDFDRKATATGMCVQRTAYSDVQRHTFYVRKERSHHRPALAWLHRASLSVSLSDCTKATHINRQDRQGAATNCHTTQSCTKDRWVHVTQYMSLTHQESAARWLTTAALGSRLSGSRMQPLCTHTQKI